jgi:hypothetical protein
VVIVSLHLKGGWKVDSVIGVRGARGDGVVDKPAFSSMAELSFDT